MSTIDTWLQWIDSKYKLIILAIKVSEKLSTFDKYSLPSPKKFSYGKLLQNNMFKLFLKMF